MSSLVPINSIWPNPDGKLGENKFTIPDGINTKWPEGDAIVGNFVFKNGKLAGFVDTKSLVINESKSTTFPYDFVKITLDDELEKSLTINKGERNRYLDVKYEDISDNFILPEGYQRVEYLESINRLPYIAVTDMNLSTDIGFEAKFTQNEINTDANNPWYVCSCGVKHGIYPRPTIYPPLFQYWVTNSISPQPSSYLKWQYNTRLSIEETTDKQSIKMDFVPGTYISSTNFYNNGNVTFDGKIIDKCGILDKSIETIQLIAIFTFGNGNECHNPYNFKGKVHHVKVTKGDKLVKNLIPTLGPTGAPCLYDTVNNKAWYNSGAGQFSYPAPSPTMTTDMENKLYGKKSEYGIQKLYKTPDNYSGTIEDYVSEYGFKEIVEPPKPEEGYWTPEWTETDAQLILQWIETEEPIL